MGARASGASHYRPSELWSYRGDGKFINDFCRVVSPRKQPTEVVRTRARSTPSPKGADPPPDRPHERLLRLHPVGAHADRSCLDRLEAQRPFDLRDQMTPQSAPELHSAPHPS